MGKNSQHLNTNFCYGLSPSPLQRQTSGKVFRERQTCETVIINNFYFLVETLFFLFLIFLERMSWNARSLEPSLAGKGGADKKSLSPPHLRSPPASHRWILERVTCISEATAHLRKVTRTQKQAALPASANVLLRLPLLPSLQAFLVWFRTSF